MAKLGVITDGISRDFEHALGVMSEVGLDYAEHGLLVSRFISKCAVFVRSGKLQQPFEQFFAL